MITSRIRIEGDSTIYDMYQKFGFIYKDSDTIFSPPEKKRDSTSYADEHGEHSYNKTVYDAFDYNVSFVISKQESVKRECKGQGFQRCHTFHICRK